ncbi:Piwi-domain-containing protein [Tothia fuscella]|uniref:Piwi-domain-containing protein n=1 Tax=Tothia fuscella TaxID=1048955 RepID=A0A9P4NER4_9PEZI|nr:Piwi-domain-containing protein [Tothia fuscella]
MSQRLVPRPNNQKWQKLEDNEEEPELDGLKTPDSEFSDKNLKNKTPHVITNYLPVKTWPSLLVEYSLSFGKILNNEDKPPSPVNERREKIRVLSGLREYLLSHGVNIQWSSDGTLLWSTARFDSQPGTHASQPHVEYNDVEFQTQNGSVKKISFVLLNHQADYNLTNPASTFPGYDLIREPKLITAMNAIVMEQISLAQKTSTTGHLHVEQVGANKFFYDKAWAHLSGGGRFDQNRKGDLITMRGYFISVRPSADNRLLLNVNTATSAFFQPMLVSQFLTNWGGNLPKASEILKGVRVRITYDRDQHENTSNANPNDEEYRTKYITEIIEGRLNRQKFSKRGQKQGPPEGSLVLDYYKELGLRPQSSNNCLVNCGTPLDRNGHPTPGTLFYPAEYLEITPYNIIKRTLNGNHSDAMKDVAILPLTFGPGLLKIPAAFLPPPDVLYSGTLRKTGTGAMGIRNARWSFKHGTEVCKFREPATIEDLFVIRLTYNSFAVNMDQIYSNFITACTKHGMISKCLPLGRLDQQRNLLNIPIQRDQTFEALYPHLLTSLRSKIQSSFSVANRAATHKPLALIILPSQDADLYGAVKKVFDCALGMPNICCQSEKLAKTNPTFSESYLFNLTAKANFKLGGQVHKLDDRSWAGVDTERLLIMGADVTHPSPGSPLGTPSIAALVGSVNNDLVTFEGSVRLQKSRSEIIGNMEEMARERILSWSARNRAFPIKIIFYRDGVSESQYDAVRRHEIQAIRDAYDKIVVDGQKPQLKGLLQITFLVVGKRHNTRFYPDGDDNTTSKDNSNVKPGLLVDSVVTRGNIKLPDGKVITAKDFYLQSHQALLGTARSAHYVVLENEVQKRVRGGVFVKLSDHDIQTITHSCCYTYSRCTSAVSYCTPAYYADRLCARAREYFKSCRNLVDKPGARRDEQDRQDYDDYVEQWKSDVPRRISTNPAWQPYTDAPNPWWGARWIGDAMFWL